MNKEKVKEKKNNCVFQLKCHNISDSLQLQRSQSKTTIELYFFLNLH